MELSQWWVTPKDPGDSAPNLATLQDGEESMDRTDIGRKYQGFHHMERLAVSAENLKPEQKALKSNLKTPKGEY